MPWIHQLYIIGYLSTFITISFYFANVLIFYLLLCTRVDVGLGGPGEKQQVWVCVSFPDLKVSPVKETDQLHVQCVAKENFLSCLPNFPHILVKFTINSPLIFLSLICGQLHSFLTNSFFQWLFIWKGSVTHVFLSGNIVFLQFSKNLAFSIKSLKSSILKID